MTSRRRLLVWAAGATAAAILSVPLIVWAGGGDEPDGERAPADSRSSPGERFGGGPFRLDTQSVKWTSQQRTTAGSEWTEIDGISGGVAGCAKGGATAAVSLQLAAPASEAEVRVVMRDLSLRPPPQRAMRPRKVTFDSGLSSFTFVTENVLGSHGARFLVQWRSATASPATMRRGSISILWNAPPACE